MTAGRVGENAHISALQGLLGDSLLETVEARDEITAYIEPQRIVDACAMLKARGFNRLSAVTAVDWHPAEPRFEVVYQLHSLPLHSGGQHERLRLKCRVAGATPEIDSVTQVWQGANWYEREVFDLFGIVFRNHPDLTRILLPEGFQGNPLRKDYPIHGYKYSYAQD